MPLDIHFNSSFKNLRSLQQIFAVSTRQYGHRAVLKFAAHTGCTPIAGRFTPGTFTNQRQKGFREPRLLIVSDPLTDHQAIFESAYANVPVVAFSNTDARLKFVDIAVPWNTKSQYAIGVMWWLLTREVLRLRGQLLRTTVWTIVPDLYFYRDPEDEAEEAALEAAVAKADRSVSDVEKLLAAVDLDEAKRGDEATVSNAIETEMVGGDEWPDQFRVADWNEAVQVDDEASKAQTTSAATWGADGKLF